ncbi:MAG: (Fe-S)-binding protein [Deltaproteobacteria bacterium]|nr:(Fe-S)-binding protein [Deltaproteobacteria bacterium]
MESVLISPASAEFFGISLKFFGILIPIIGISLFIYIMSKRIFPLTQAQPDFRTDKLGKRIMAFLKVGVGQARHPRFFTAGIIHIVIFAGFLILALNSINLVIVGFIPGFTLPGLSGAIGGVYIALKNIAATLVLIACIVAMIRRGLFTPERYKVPEKYGHDHTAEAVFVLIIISVLMITDSLFEAAPIAEHLKTGAAEELIIPGTITWFFVAILKNASQGALQSLYLLSYFIHDLVFFFFLCFLPLGKHFHVITGLLNIFLSKLNKGSIKPVKWGISEEGLDDLESFGVKKITDFTWKHILDFYSCADCGRCSDRCPANRVKRPLSPRFISIKARDYIFNEYPICGESKNRSDKENDNMLIGDIFEEDEIWSCTTCGACEAECPILIEYIDKIVDLRRAMVDEGMVPQSLQKPLSALNKRGNPYGKLEKKRSAWVKEKDFAAECEVKVLSAKQSADTLYFVDSITSYDDRMILIAQATSKILNASEIDFGILGKAEKDSGNEVRRFGEEMLFCELKNQNIEAISEAGVKSIVVSDPHALNTLKNEYDEIPKTEHISQLILRQLKENKITLSPETTGKTYAYHDPCYLGRHNDIYDAPREVIDAIPNIKRVEIIDNCKDRSFCCGGGGLMLFYEPEEETRMGTIRVQMAKESEADVIVTACPFCMVNIEDAIKTSGLEGEMEVIDIAELIANHIK